MNMILHISPTILLSKQTARTKTTRRPPENIRLWNHPYRKPDAEAGVVSQFPVMLESSHLLWAFICKVYSILSVQLVATVAVAVTVVSVPPIAAFFVRDNGVLALYILLIMTPFIVLWPLYYYHQYHPVNYILLGIFTVSLAFAVGLTCAFTNGKLVLESLTLTTVAVISLNFVTFWAARRRIEFSFLGPFMFAALLILLVFGMIQLFFPLGRASIMVYGCLASIIFCGYIIYDTGNLLSYSYDDYIWAAVAIYLDVINLFLSMFTSLRVAES